MMCGRRLIFLAVIAVAAAGVAGGCDRAKSKGSDRPAVATTAPATRPVAEGEKKSILTINGQAYTFPPVRLVVDEKQDAGVLAQVYSEGASPEGAADGYYFELPLPDVADATQLDGAAWQYTTKSGERDDRVLTAITVNGGQNQLLPKDVTVTFREVAPDVYEVRVIGFFNVFGSHGTAGVATGVVPVEATLVARRQAMR